MVTGVEAVCNHLNEAHSVGEFGGQTGPIIIEFSERNDRKIVVGSKGVCLSANGACSHMCKTVVLTHRSMSMTLKDPENLVKISPTPPIEANSGV